MNETRVYLIGAGPGNPGFLTLRAAECLVRADLVIYDKLVPERVLSLARDNAQRVCVTELASRHVERCPRVQELMIEAARQGKQVVRLKGGDPFIFGRGGEEADSLRAAGIPYEVVPGITAAIGAAACAGIPLTHRSYASGVALVTGHEDHEKGESAIDWPALATFPGTLVIYMGIGRLPRIVQALLESGKAADTPAAVVQWASTGDQQTIEAPLGTLPDVVRGAGLTAPAVIIVGSVVSLRVRPSWFEQRPLFGKRILVTRPRSQAGELARRLEELGAVPFELPAVEIRQPGDWTPVDSVIGRLTSYDWLVFTSVNGVHAFLGRLRHLGRDLRALGGLKLAAIGPATAEALRTFHLMPDLVPEKYCSEGLVQELKKQVQGKRVLLARADRGRELLRQELAQLAEVDSIAVYSQVDAVNATSPIFDHLRRGEIDYVTLTSSNIARAFLETLDETCRGRIESGQVKLATISPVTSAAVRELGLPVAAEATVYTTAGIVSALLKLAGRDGFPS